MAPTEFRMPNPFSEGVRLWPPTVPCVLPAEGVACLAECTALAWPRRHPHWRRGGCHAVWQVRWGSADQRPT